MARSSRSWARSTALISRWGIVEPDAGRCRAAEWHPHSSASEAKSGISARGRLICSLPNHRSAEETEHVIDRVRNGAGAAPGKQQADGPRIGRDVLDHERARVAAVQDPAALV